MNKIISSLSLIAILGLINCGGTSEEGKELLQRILTVVGIPHDIVVNICQDTNSNGICESQEIQTKITINKNDKLNAIWGKIALSSDGKYFLENYDSTKNILMELQNAEKFKFDNGKFTFIYNPPTQELSILQAMIDAGYLQVDDVIAVKKMNAVNDFYAVLLEDVYSNLNILRELGLASKNVVFSVLSEMGDELLDAGIKKEFPDAMNACGDDKKCTDALLAGLSKKLLIDEEEAKIILNGEDEATKKEPIIPATRPFSTVWKTDNSGVSANNQITIPTDEVSTDKNKKNFNKNGQSAYDYTVDWGDGHIDNNLTGDATHDYEEAGEYTVHIYGKFPHLALGKNTDYKINTVESDARKLLSIIQWGDIKWKSMENSFIECTVLESRASDKPNLFGVTNMKSMFFGAKKFNQDIGDWDVSTITNMESMFAHAEKFNQNLSNWNVSRVTNMKEMFKYAVEFEQNIGNWNISNVTNMTDMFKNVSLSIENYDNILIGWHNQNVQKNVVFNAGYSQYSSDAKDAKNDLEKNYNWTIFDSGQKEEKHYEEEEEY